LGKQYQANEDTKCRLLSYHVRSIYPYGPLDMLVARLSTVAENRLGNILWRVIKSFD